jgi:hypothetical protein
VTGRDSSGRAGPPPKTMVNEAFSAMIIGSILKIL